MKTCSVCQTEKPLTEYCKNKTTKDGLHYACKVCTKAYRDAWKGKNNPERFAEFREHRKQYRAQRKDVVAEEKRAWRAKYKEKIVAREKAYKQANRDTIRVKKNAFEKQKKAKCSLYRTIANLRSLINKVFERKGWKRDGGRTEQILGCSFEELYAHLVSTALRNYGYYVEGQVMHIDHVVPIATAKTEEDVIRLNHYTNLQWLTPEDNLKKGAKVG